MISTPNGCMCHMLRTKPLEEVQCKSCEGRSKSPYKCSRCKVGVWGPKGDYSNHGGLCTQCYEEDHNWV